MPGVPSYLNFDLLVTEQRDQMRDDARVDDHLDLLVPSVRQIGQSPHCVYQDLEAAKKKGNSSLHFATWTTSSNSEAFIEFALLIVKRDQGTTACVKNSSYLRWHQCGGSARRAPAESENRRKHRRDDYGEKKTNMAFLLCKPALFLPSSAGLTTRNQEVHIYYFWFIPIFF